VDLTTIFQVILRSQLPLVFLREVCGVPSARTKLADQNDEVNQAFSLVSVDA